MRSVSRSFLRRYACLSVFCTLACFVKTRQRDLIYACSRLFMKFGERAKLGGKFEFSHVMYLSNETASITTGMTALLPYALT